MVGYIESRNNQCVGITMLVHIRKTVIKLLAKGAFHVEAASHDHKCIGSD